MIQIFINNLVELDTRFSSKIFYLNGRKTIDAIMRFSSFIGNGYFYPLIGLMIYFLAPFNRFTVILTVITAFLIELPIQKLVKITLKRKRPCQHISGIYNLVKLPDDFSFPSGHTAGACILTVILSYYYPFLLIPGISFCILMGISRIYNGVHYVSDVLCGAGLGVICSYTSLLII